LNLLVAHEHADLTATIQAGARLEEVNRALARHGQWLPIESAFDDTTIGGLIATNDSGPLRHRYGTPRDLLIGIRLALTDGRLIKAGGNVVKNVAGYDLGRLMSGSHGSLAAIVSATFKLSPRPAASGTVVAAFDDPDALAAAVERLTGSQLEASACEVHSATGAGRLDSVHRLLLKFESTPGALDAHLQQARAMTAGMRCDVVTGPSESHLWREYTRLLWASPGAILRVAWLPAHVGQVLTFVRSVRAHCDDVELAARAAIGSGLLRIGADANHLKTTIASMRTDGLFRHVAVLRADAALKQEVDVWGMRKDAAALGAALKRALDPHGILNAGRGPV
jgi:glycolate oxidase FAD binding subunit